MKNTVIRFGLYSLLVMAVLLALSFGVFHRSENWDGEEVFGYVSIVLAQVLIYFGIRYWRDRYNGGRISFGRGMGIGTLITIFPSVGFGLFSMLEMKWLDPDMCNKYFAYNIEKIKKSTPPDQLQAVLQKMQEQKEMFSNPILMFIGMFMTVFVIGVIITVISALILKRNKARTA